MVHADGSLHTFHMLLFLFAGYHFSSRNFDNTYATTETIHKMIESFKFAYAQRAYLGDEDFVNVTEVSD